MPLHTKFKIVSHKPGFVGITPVMFHRASLTIAEAREMAAHLTKICDALESMDKTVVQAVDDQNRN